MPLRETLLVPHVSKAAELFYMAASSMAGLAVRDMRAWFSEPQPSAPRKALIINGHPDPSPDRFCAALARACADGARSAGFETQELCAAHPSAPENVQDAPAILEDIHRIFREAGDLTIVFPLWLNHPPELLVRFIDGVQRQSIDEISPGERPRRTRFVVTMEMPAFPLRAAAKGRAIADLLPLPGIAAQEAVFIGSVGTIPFEHRRAWLNTVRDMHAEAR